MSSLTPNLVLDLLFLLGAFLVGSIPFGLLLAKRYLDLDLRQLGSGNIGATNAYRAGGKAFGAIVLLLDLLKGYLPPLLVIMWGHSPEDPLSLAAGGMAVFGHCCSPWLGFQGGKGVATTLGVTLALAPTLAAGGLLIYVLVVFLFRVSGLGSLIAIGLMSIASWWSHGHGMGITLGAIYALVVWRHRSNIQALVARDTE
ncbi:MAG TPA: acyl-phosphate glycerol 3-phosphate acyltransferase [Myxococcales bacterium]|nr:acyl-phosphate glycerol 3-phosphate acyltransferase [Myxococcales bacterium]|tara:strand:+ start:299 stop:898 length:600 start_codon:yes stop_codon:yes gene_type:complete